MPRDAVVGVVILAFAGLYWLAAGSIRHSSLDDSIGASGLPNTLAAVLAGLAILLVLRNLVSRPRAAPAAAGDAPGQTPTSHLRAFGMLTLGIGYLMVVPYLGYALSVALLVGSVALYNHQKPTPRLALITVLIAVGFYVLFVKVLGIPLPTGIWPAFLPV